ncbi:MAG: SDR family NAD(P)-dependent oxidoreductase, partial [Methylococcaceae bacterium]|nr:SDR family NAD(P)-dependent oxidoreductase [Methylococcaceae bacterium]
IQQVCAQYAVDTQSIYYFEAHGTGTPVGDPLEANALSAALGPRDPQKAACLLGSAKATIGHLEAAAGVAGVIKTALCLAHRQIPPQANLETPNPNIPFAELGLRLPRHLEALAPGVDEVYAGVNSFGYGGTNAHAILANVPVAATDMSAHVADATDKHHVLPLSARSEQALADLASAWLQRFNDDAVPSVTDLCYSAACRRGHHNYRLAATGNTWAGLRGQLESFVAQGTAPGLAVAKTTGESEQNPVFVYTGMGPQWWAMGRELYQHEPVYKAAVEACDQIFRRLAGWSILEAMLADEQDSTIADTTVAQPANFLIQVGLTALWQAQGIEPAAIVGHSVGEVSAAYAAGVLSLEEAMLVSYQRSRIQKKAAGLGKMLAVGVSQDYCEDLIALTNGEVSIAAINSPTSITLAGEATSLEAIAAYLTEQGEFNRFLQVEVAYHSPFMEPLKPEVREVLAGLQPKLPKVPLYSTITGELVTEVLYDAEYWCNNIREPVYFAKAMASLLADGHRVFLEVGPHPVLSTAIKECCRVQGITPLSIASLRKDKPERATLALALAELYVAGCHIDWALLTATDAHYVKLPSYPWQRERYWSESEESSNDRVADPIHPLLDKRLPDPRPTWQSAVNRQLLPYLQDHQVDGLVVMPGAAYIEACLAARHQLTGDARCTLGQLAFNQALVLDAGGNEPVIHVSLDANNGEFNFFSRDFDQPLHWQLHASAIVTDASDTNAKPHSLKDIAEQCLEYVDVEGLYSDLAQRGLSYGPYFQGIQQLRRGAGEVLAHIELHPDLQQDNSQYHLHPSLLDACFQSLIVALEQSDKFYMPIAIKRIAYHQKPGASFWCHGNITRANQQGIVGNLSLFDADGTLLVEVEGLHCRALAVQKASVQEQLQHWAYSWQWLPQALPAHTAKSGSWLVFSDGGVVGETLCAQLKADNNSVLVIPVDQAYEQEANGVQLLNDSERAHLYNVLHKAKDSQCLGIVYLWGLDARNQSADPVGNTQASVALQIIQMLGEVFTSQAPRLYMVTSGAQSVLPDDMVGALAQTPLIGLARVALNEYPAMRCTHIDLDSRDVLPSVTALSQEIRANDAEDDLALRGANRYVHRLERLPVAPVELLPQTVNGTEVPAVQLVWQGLPAFASAPLAVPKLGEVAVAVETVNLTGVNLALADQDDTVQGYFAVGVISAIGAGVSHWQVGDAVLVAVEGTPASSVVCPSERVFSAAPLRGLAKADMAALATTLIPAYYALHTLARVAANEAVLIDAHMGSRAMAAYFVASSLGLQPYFYAADSSHALALNGAPVLDASLDGFAERLAAIAKVTPIRVWLHGVDAENQQLLAQALAVNTHEIILADAPVYDLPVYGLCSSSVVNPLSLAFTSPALFGQLLLELGQLLIVRQQWLTLATVFSPTEALLALSGHVGTPSGATPVLSLGDKRGITLVLEPRQPTAFTADGSYLITGGFGGFGLEAAHWLAKQGVKHLVLVGRRGAADAQAQAAVASLEKQGVQVLAAAADIADEAQVVALLTRIEAQMPPLKGVFHAAAVLDDAPIADLDAARMAKVFGAKALGAWYLHQHTQHHALDFFMLFSSVSALIGNARQANYVAANTFLDALAHHRNALGLPATSINWGAIKTGMAVESAEVQTHLQLMGMNALTVGQALEAWLLLKDSNEAQYGLMDCDWGRWQAFEPTGGNSPRFAKLMADKGKQQSAMTTLCLAISELPEAEQAAAMAQAFAEQVAKTLRMPVSKVDLQQSLAQMGVDSLISAELQATIHQAFGVRMSTLELMRGQNLAQLAEVLLERTVLSAANEASAAPEQDEASLVDRMSLEEIDSLLNQILLEEEK